MAKIYFYNVGYDSYEESPSVVLYHNQKFSEKEFQNLCASVTAKIYKNRDKLSESRHFILYENKKLKTGIKFEDLYRLLTDELCKNHGFKKIEYSSIFSPFGWAQVDDEKDWNENGVGDEGSDLKAKRDKIFSTRIILTERVKKK